MIRELLLSKGYKCWKEDYDDNLDMESNHYQRRVLDNETDAVCELNDRLHINVTETKFKEYPRSYEVEIRAERKGIWVDFKLYSISEEKLTADLDGMEKTLITMFNMI